MTNAEDSDISSIEGEELSGVCFVRDYIEFHFDGPVLRLLGKVLVYRGGMSVSGDSSRLKNWICDNIGKSVESLNTNSANKLSIQFADGDRIELLSVGLGEEFAHFISFPDNRMQIWVGD